MESIDYQRGIQYFLYMSEIVIFPIIMFLEFLHLPHLRTGITSKDLKMGVLGGGTKMAA